MARSWYQEEHVAHAQKAVGTHFIENHATIATTRHLKRDPSWQVALDQTCNHIHSRLLRRQDQVHPHSTGLLSDPHDVVFHLFRGRHHQVRHFVGDDHNIGHIDRDAGLLGLVFRTQASIDLISAQHIISLNVTNTHPGQECIPFVHLLTGPGQHALGLFHVGHNRVHQVRNLFELREFHHLRVDQQELDFVWPFGHQNRDDHGVQTDRLTRPGSASDQQVRHIREVIGQCRTLHVLAKEQRNLHSVHAFAKAVDNLSQLDDASTLVRNFNPHGTFARNRGYDPHARNGQGTRQVVSQPHNSAHPKSCLKLNFELGDDWSSVNLNHTHLVTKFFNRLLDHLSTFLETILIFLDGGHWLFEDTERREQVIRVFRRLLGHRSSGFGLIGRQVARGHSSRQSWTT